MSGRHDQDREIALEIAKAWLEQYDVAYLAKENVYVHWEQFAPDSKKGEYVKYTPGQACRIVKATRSGIQAMKFITHDVMLLAAQELERTYKQGVNSRSTTPPEYFNFCRHHHFNNLELLTISLLQELVGRGWNIEAVCLGEVMESLFKRKGFAVPNRTLRWRLLRAVAEEAGMIVRDRLNRLTVYGVGRFVCLQIVGIDDSIKTSLTEEELDKLISDTLIRYLAI